MVLWEANHDEHMIALFNPNTLSARIIVVALVAGIVYDIFILRSGSDTQLFLLSFLWLSAAGIGRWGSSATIKLSLCLLVLLFLLFLFGDASFMTERIATWLYIFIVIAVIQQFIELRHPGKHS